MYNEPESTARTTPVHLNDCHNPEQNVFSSENDVDSLIEITKSYHENPIVAYLNINCLSNKIINLREILLKAPIDILCIDETKLDAFFPDAQFLIDNYHFPPFRKDRNSKGGGKMVS